MRQAARTKPPAPSAVAPNYLDEHLRGLDHGRVILPAEWRLDAFAKEFMVIEWPLMKHEFLLALTPARWEFLQKKIEDLPLTDEQAATVQRLIGASTSRRSLDSYGRLPLPENALAGLGIESEAMLVGRLSKFEIWSPSRYAAKKAAPEVQSLAEVVQSIRV